MTRLFAGTQWDRPPTCEVCGRLEAECVCPPRAEGPARVPPEKQTALLTVEKRPKGKVVTVVSGLAPDGDVLAGLASRLKTACGTGGALKDGRVELQGDRRDAAERLLRTIGYKTKRR